MNKLEWKKGWPPFAGWWNMSAYRNRFSWRWVDPETRFISCFSLPTDCEETARQNAEKQCFYQISDLEYTDHWPENARVPRIDPRKK